MAIDIVPQGGAGTAEHPTSLGLDSRKVAMWTFLGSECMFFGALIATYLLFHTHTGDGPTPHEIYNIPYTSVSSFVLLMSSLTMVLALAAIQRGDHRGLRIWLLATAFLGMTFIGGQVYEFTEFFKEGLTIKTSPFGSAFFMLTGFHGAHVTIGILMLLSLFSLSRLGKLPTSDSLKVELVGLYWHFVDVVWIVIFTVVYLIPAAKR
jgi:cytochrome c oxidase subunit 3/cytochrome o ubiquinol oxidase subunit 3